MTISIREKFGLPFIIERYKKRLGLLIGIIIFCSTLFVLNFFVWDVTVSGNSSVSTQKVLEKKKKYDLIKDIVSFYVGAKGATDNKVNS